MKKISANSLCPCGSRVKYKRCCQKYHKGAYAPTALLLMKSRYSAYAVGESDYIIKTTHPNNSDFTEDRLSWRRDIEHFSSTSQFLKLEILDFIDGEREAFVTFIATLSSGELREKSRFLKVDNQWLYESMVEDNQ